MAKPIRADAIIRAMIMANIGVVLFFLGLSLLGSWLFCSASFVSFGLFVCSAGLATEAGGVFASGLFFGATDGVAGLAGLAITSTTCFGGGGIWFFWLSGCMYKNSIIHKPIMNIDKISQSLNGGGVAVLPTDTVYGICALAGDQEAVKRLYQLKSRDKKPGTVIAGSIDQLVDIGIKRRYLKAVEQFWPGPISVVIPVSRDLEYLDLGKGSIAVRVVGDQNIVNLLSKTGALLTSSANLPGQPEASSIEEAKKTFGDKIDLYVDGGDFSGKLPSTVIRVVDDAVEILREGIIKVNKYGEVEN